MQQEAQVNRANERGTILQHIERQDRKEGVMEDKNKHGGIGSARDRTTDLAE